MSSTYGLAPPVMRWSGLVGCQKQDDGQGDTTRRLRPFDELPAASTTTTVVTRALRFRQQTSKWTAASVRHAEAVMDQMMVTQLMRRQDYQPVVGKPVRYGDGVAQT